MKEIENSKSAGFSDNTMTRIRRDESVSLKSKKMSGIRLKNGRCN